MPLKHRIALLLTVWQITKNQGPWFALLGQGDAEGRWDFIPVSNREPKDLAPVVAKLAVEMAGGVT